MADQTLNIGAELQVPVDILTTRGWIAGLPKTGKTSTTVVEVEEAWKRGVPSAVITPTDVWHGIRSSADGEHEGLGHVLFGGAHGDLPLRPDMGGALARLVAGGLSIVITLSGMKLDDRATLVADYCETLLEVNRSPMLQVFDEAHLLAPQGQASSDERKRCRDAIIAIVATGRAPAQIGVRCVTQRLSRLHKDITELAELVVVHQLKGPNDRKAARPWLEDYFENPAPLLARLPRLGRGEAFYVAPEYEIAGVFQVRVKETFDTSDSERISDNKKREPKGRATVDLGDLKKTLGKAVEQTLDEDPKHLRARIAELERQLKEAPAAEPVVERIEVPVIDPRAVQMLSDLAGDVSRRVPELERAASKIQTSLQDALTLPEASNGKPKPGRVRHEAFDPPLPPPPPSADGPGETERPTEKKVPQRRAQMANLDGEIKLTKVMVEILDTLAANRGVFPSGMTPEQVGMFTGRKPRGASWWVAIKGLVDGGLMTNEPNLKITAAGIEKVPDAKSVPRDQIIALWRKKMTKPGQEILDVLVANPDRIFTDKELGEIVGRKPRGASWWVAMAALREAPITELSADNKQIGINPDFALAPA